ncbi:hypothetical protein G5I_08988 [Acromyrmex echinatior]|uniref:Uncharacterized protein n=1 Tax=Acromyrmex echinatior TaxID=103372 RepID=F4WT14_ACREC|nr:hypothetical protein G5I_08988 [Acromyrmex echinatior]
MQNRGRTFVHPLTAALAASTLGDIIRQTLGRGDLSCYTSVRTVISGRAQPSSARHHRQNNSVFRKISKVTSHRLGKCEHIDVSVYQWRRLVVKVSESDSSQLRKAFPDLIPVAFTIGRPPLSIGPISNLLDDFRDTGEEKLSKNHIAKFV